MLMGEGLYWVPELVCEVKVEGIIRLGLPIPEALEVGKGSPPE